VLKGRFPRRSYSTPTNSLRPSPCSPIVDAAIQSRYSPSIMAIETFELRDRIASLRERLEAFGRYL